MPDILALRGYIEAVEDPGGRLRGVDALWERWRGRDRLLVKYVLGVKIDKRLWEIKFLSRGTRGGV